MKPWEWLAFIAGIILIGAVMAAVFFVSFEFAMMFMPFILLFGLIAGIVRKKKHPEDGQE